MRPTLTERRARFYYWRHAEFQSIVARIGSPENLKKLNDKIESELRNKLHVRLFKYFSLGIKVSLGVCIALAALKILSLSWALTSLVAILAIYFGTKKASERLREGYFQKYKKSLQSAEDNDVVLINRIESEWESYCVNFPGYPPDWKHRRLLTLERDGHRCTECAWPNETKRKVRELHVHHVKRLSKEGTNALPNLIVLCDICHKKQEGSGHARINPRSRKRKSGDR